MNVDNIERLLKEIKDDAAVWKLRDGRDVIFSGKFLDTIGEIFEKYGVGTARIFLANQMGRDRTQAVSLIKVMDKFKKYPEVMNNRAIGRYIIKTLDQLKRMEV